MSHKPARAVQSQIDKHPPAPNKSGRPTRGARWRAYLRARHRVALQRRKHLGETPELGRDEPLGRLQRRRVALKLLRARAEPFELVLEPLDHGRVHIAAAVAVATAEAAAAAAA